MTTIGHMVRATNPRLVECQKLNCQSEVIIPGGDSQVQLEQREHRGDLWTIRDQMLRVLAQPPHPRYTNTKWERTKKRELDWVPCGSYNQRCPTVVQTFPLYYSWPQCQWVTLMALIGQILKQKSSTQSILKFICPLSIEGKSKKQESFSDNFQPPRPECSCERQKGQKENSSKNNVYSLT